MRRIVPTLLIGVMMSGGLAACGGNTEELQREAVGCTTYFTVLNEQIVRDDPALADRIMAALVDPASVDADQQKQTINRTLVDMAGGTDAWRAEMDPAAVATLDNEQSALARRHVAEDRSAEAAERISTCIDTWKRLKR
ncbi:hypothetical protein [Brevundimonas sp.]|uniref:hypothetical protein n=1 Tax=Brevundimonas sp. TaxID=1871086 RepID=UPI001DF1A951|nr:hypothetical protein [Brevundimonas sp.]MBL0946515.1 hypothetical protein [Brevundimonas sp.]